MNPLVKTYIATNRGRLVHRLQMIIEARMREILSRDHYANCEDCKTPGRIEKDAARIAGEIAGPVFDTFIDHI